MTAGIILFQIEEEPIQFLKVGDAFYEPVNINITHFDNNGETPAKFVASICLEKTMAKLFA
jgi:hypothetical protein